MISHSFNTEFGRHCIWIEYIYLEDELRGTGAASEFFDQLKERYADKDVGIAAADITLAATEMGYGACIIGNFALCT